MNGSPFDLRWRLFGVRFCIQPSFWLMNALWGFLLSGAAPLGGDRRGVLFFILLWVLCVLVSVMIHELGHVITGRFFGQPGNITLAGMGGQAAGNYTEINAAWKRILVIFAGPGAGFVFLFLLMMLDSTWWDWSMDWLNWQSLKLRMHLIRSIAPKLEDNAVYQLVMVLLFSMNLFWGLINLLPIIPMDGGMIFKELCCVVSPHGGLKFAFAVSLLLSGVITVYYILVILQLYRVVKFPFELYYPFAFPEMTLIMFGMMAYQNFMGLRQVTMMQKHSMYARRDDDGDDDGSGPRGGPYGVKEVPVKDPRDFAPPAPGSETPRR